MSIINSENSVVAILQSKLSDSYQCSIRQLTQETVRRLAQSASRLMAHSKSETLELQHLEMAIQSLQLDIISQQDILISTSSDDYITLDSEINSCQRQLSKFTEPSVAARWVVIDDCIPSIHQNKLIKRINRSKEEEESKEKFNIIHDTPLSFLLPQQLHLLKFIQFKLNADKELTIANHWSNLSLIPFIMVTLMTNSSSDNRVRFLLQLVRSKALNNSIEYYLHQIMALFLNYQGELSWEVGLEISKLISRWQYKYPHLHNIFWEAPGTYSSKIKRLAYEVYFRVSPTISMVGVREDAESGNRLAIILTQLINQCWLRFKYEKCQYHQYFSEGRAGLMADEYLNSIL